MKEKALGKTDMTRIATKENRDLFARFGQSKEFGKVEKAGLMSVEVNQAIKRGDDAALAKAVDGLMGRFTKKDSGTAAFNDLYSGKVGRLGLLDRGQLKAFGVYVAHGIAAKNPGLVASAIPRMESQSRRDFEKAYRTAIDVLATEDADRAKEAKESFEKTLANYAVGFGPPEEGEAPLATPSPAPDTT